MHEITAWLSDVASLAGAALAALVALVHLLDWLDTIFPNLLPYTSWLTDPLGTMTGGRRERYAKRGKIEE
jgi:hypothetical protein